jgi:hypothetical protein
MLERDYVANAVVMSLPYFTSLPLASQAALFVAQFAVDPNDSGCT